MVDVRWSLDDEQVVKFRRDLLNEMTGIGWPRDKAEEAIDVALHAIKESVATTLRICQLGSMKVIELQATAMACGILGNHYTKTAQQALKEIRFLNNFMGEGDGKQ